jgi:hypothetical protein
MCERLIRLLSELPSAEPDAARSEQIRVRCRTRLARQVPGASASSAPAPGGRTAQLWQPLIAILGVAYLAEVVVQALRIYRLS